MSRPSTLSDRLRESSRRGTAGRRSTRSVLDHTRPSHSRARRPGHGAICAPRILYILTIWRPTSVLVFLQEAMEKYAVSKRELDEVVSQMEVSQSRDPSKFASPLRRTDVLCSMTTVPLNAFPRASYNAPVPSPPIIDDPATYGRSIARPRTLPSLAPSYVHLGRSLDSLAGLLLAPHGETRPLPSSSVALLL